MLGFKTPPCIPWLQVNPVLMNEQATMRFQVEEVVSVASRHPSRRRRSLTLASVAGSADGAGGWGGEAVDVEAQIIRCVGC